MIYSFVGIGELLWDMFPTGKELGGAPANFTYHVNALGGEGLIVSCVGTDHAGNEILKRLSNLSLSCEYICKDKEHPTGTVSINIGTSGHPSYNIREKVAWDYIPEGQQLINLSKKIKVVAFGTLAQRSEVSRATIRAFINRLPSEAIRIFDINLRQNFYSIEIVEWSLESCDILKLNEEELKILSDLVSITGNKLHMLQELTSRFNLKLIALTRGPRGSLLYTPEYTSIHEGYKTEVVDTVGSGDAFAAALALGTISGLDINIINDYANRVASFVCSKRGATPPLPEELKITGWLAQQYNYSNQKTDLL